MHDYVTIYGEHPQGRECLFYHKICRECLFQCPSITTRNKKPSRSIHKPMAGSSDLSIYNDPGNYDWTQTSSSESEQNIQEMPPSKRPADEEAMEVRESEAASTRQSQTTPTKKSPRKRPEPTEGYIYGFILPFTVNNAEYYVVKIGKTRADQVGRRLREHNNEFIKATNGIPIFTESISRATPDEVNDLVKWKEQAKVFLLSYVKGNLRAAESGARACIGVAPFNTEPIFKTVFPNSEKVTTTEWVVARKQVVEEIQVEFWHNKLDRFDTVDAFLKKLQELNKRDYVKLRISLESINYKLYDNEVKVPQYVKKSGS